MRVPITVYFDTHSWGQRLVKAFRLLRVAWELVLHGNTVMEVHGEIAGFRMPPDLRAVEPDVRRVH